MNLQDYVGVAQSAAITVVFLFLSYKAPGIIDKFWAWREKQDERDLLEAEKIRQHENSIQEKQNLHVTTERNADRAARHDTTDSFNKAILEIMESHERTNVKRDEVLTELRVALESFCRYRNEHRRKKRPDLGEPPCQQRP